MSIKEIVTAIATVRETIATVRETIATVRIALFNGAVEQVKSTVYFA